MLRFGFDHFGPADVFTAIDAPTPVPKPGQVLIDVLGFGLNPYDASLRRGEQADSRPLKFPIVPGTDVVGRVAALGEGVSDYAVDDRVLNYRPIGGYSEAVTASTGKIAKVPATLELAAAAGLPNIGIAAYTVMHQLLHLTPGQTLAVIGASGGVGSLIVQLAKAQGLFVIATASARNVAALRDLGADEVGAYDETDTGRLFADRADAVVNAVAGGVDHGAAVAIVKPGGVIVTTAWVDVDTTGKPTITHLQLGANRPAKAEDALPALLALPQLRVRVAKTLPFTLAGVIQGHELLETHHTAGKLVVLRH
ncbi:NADP-dependent oxidoreductase [Lacticaseibacillus daqingensis]|uniref:NADP-dependent oxidoreductase n=1 Tax=Lacticaseibacillus daqingensis TaxID=2486014 RepID=UPI000F7B31E9|nr:NADP-dependent oxidoreductase [Lacticaseibacillus daqingensis]